MLLLYLMLQCRHQFLPRTQAYRSLEMMIDLTTTLGSYLAIVSDIKYRIMLTMSSFIGWNNNLTKVPPKSDLTLSPVIVASNVLSD